MRALRVASPLSLPSCAANPSIGGLTAAKIYRLWLMMKKTLTASGEVDSTGTSGLLKGTKIIVPLQEEGPRKVTHNLRGTEHYSNDIPISPLLQRPDITARSFK
ncbi:hypothetical protein F8388_020660, partial [Cannabis sativa]